MVSGISMWEGIRVEVGAVLKIKSVILHNLDLQRARVVQMEARMPLAGDAFTEKVLLY